MQPPSSLSIASARWFACGLTLVSLAVLGAAGTRNAVAQAPAEGHYLAHHEATLKDVPAGAKKARVWLVVPRRDRAQEIGEIKLSGPVTGAVTRGGTYNNSFAYFEVDNPANGMKFAADFSVTRRAVRVEPDPTKEQPLTAEDKTRFAGDLASNKYVPVGGKYADLAKQIVGEEKNPVLQSRKLYDWVLNNVEYWVKDPKNLKASPNGESDYCLTTKTGNCTDFHSLYASLSRSLGIPTRMVYGSFFQGENTPVPNKASLEGKDMDASYHCWIQFYAKGLGWVPLDVALADLLPEAQQASYFGGLDERRVTWSYGRDLTLEPAQAGPPVNAMHKVYVEIDGQPFTGWDRKFTYRNAP